MSTKSSFADFTNLYELSKTLRFELKPVWETKNFLQKDWVLEKDKQVDENYHKIKEFLDILHQNFVNESLKNVDLNYENFEKIFLEMQKLDKKERKNLEKEFDKEKQKLRNQLIEYFDIYANNLKKELENKTIVDEKGKEKFLKIDGEWINILFWKSILDILTFYFPENKELFASFNGFTTYFTNFHESRKNFYKADGTASAIATRIIDENLIFFLKNKKIYEEKYQNNEVNFSEVEKNFDIKINQIFVLENYNKIILQKDIEKFNQIIWWLWLENGWRLQGLNEKINLTKQQEFSKYKQSKKDWNIIEFKKSDYLIFRELYKQILGNSKKEEKSFIEIKDENDLIKKYIPEFIKLNNEKIEKSQNLIKNFSEKSEDFELNHIYISKIALNTISAKLFANWHLISDFLPKEKDSKWKKNIKEFISLEDIKNALEKAKIETETDLFKSDYSLIIKENIFEKFLYILNEEFKNNIHNYEKSLNNIEENILILEKLSDNKETRENQISIIKEYSDNALNLYRMMKYFALEKDKKLLRDGSLYEIDNAFYNPFDEYYNDYEIIKYYNQFRNFLTKKQFSQEKIKLNFDNGTLLDGWDKNKEPDNYGTLFRKNGKYYLGVMKKWKNHIFKTDKNIDFRENEENFYEKMEYKYAKDVSLWIPKSSTQTKEVVNHFRNNDEDFFIKKWASVWNFLEPLRVTRNIYEINNKIFLKTNLKYFTLRWNIEKKEEKNYIKVFQKDYVNLGWNIELYNEAVKNWIDFCKDFLRVYPSSSFFNYSSLKNTSDYKSIDEFYKDVDALSYSIKFNKIWDSYIEEKVNLWELYLFEIYNKDFSEKKSWSENLHTMYFKWLFEETNLQKPVLKLNWQAEIFFREKSIEEKIDVERKTNNEIIENKRYTKNKILFHCPIKLNFWQSNEKVNSEVNEFIAWNSEKIKILWIDRWEKHLAYYSLIEIDTNWNAKILDSWSFNEIDNWKQTVNYYNLLENKAIKRAEWRESWKNIENIKELKQGYISQIVHKITKIAIENNAIIVFEDLNMWFKRWRQKIEKQIYQKLEKALIEKFNYLVFKDKKLWENGNYLKAIQLTGPFETFQKMWKQTWIIFYTDASYTSTTCPNCWWRKDIYIKYKNKESAKKDFKKFEKIYFNNEKDSFIFEYKPISFWWKIKDLTSIFSNRERIKTSRDEAAQNKFTSKIIDITQNLKDIFETAEIKYQNWDNLINQIISKWMAKIDDKNLFQSLYYYLNFVLQIRNSKTWDNSRDWDFICCPKCDFDSRKENEIWVKNWDDNGAFNIAKKGILIVDKIKVWKEENKVKYPELYIKTEEFDERFRK